jgi:hypothetical protein
MPRGGACGQHGRCHHGTEPGATYTFVVYILNCRPQAVDDFARRSAEARSCPQLCPHPSYDTPVKIGSPCWSPPPGVCPWRGVSHGPSRIVIRPAIRGPACAHSPPADVCRMTVNTVILRYGRAVIPCQRRGRGRLGRLTHGAVMPGEPGGNRQPSGRTEATAGWRDDEVRPAIVPTVEFGSRQVQRAKPPPSGSPAAAAPCSPGRPAARVQGPPGGPSCCP